MSFSVQPAILPVSNDETRSIMDDYVYSVKQPIKYSYPNIILIPDAYSLALNELFSKACKK